MKDMKLIMEAFRMSTLHLVREGLTNSDVEFFLEDIPYKDPLPPFEMQEDIDNKEAGAASRTLFLQHLYDEVKKGNLPRSVEELEDMYYDYYDYWTRQLDPEDRSHLDDLDDLYAKEEGPAYNRDSKHFISRLYQKLYETFPGLKRLLPRREVKGRRVPPMAKRMVAATKRRK